MRIEKASLTHLGTLERLDVLWNPERFAHRKRSRLARSGVPGSSLDVIDGLDGGEEELTTDLLLDASRAPHRDTDLVGWVEILSSWMDPVPGEDRPPRVLFAWGAFRFRGILSSLDQLWVRFDASGRPLRGWLRLTLTRGREIDS
ncbi:MAG TPA: hypothetical protein VK116_19095 [Planctomycetota bacterium]|nr:hypothetical protein [Planctomycetota bacterium]